MSELKILFISRARATSKTRRSVTETLSPSGSPSLMARLAASSSVMSTLA